MLIGIVAPYNKEKPAGFERTTLGILRGVLAADKDNQFIIYTKRGSGLAQLLSVYTRAEVIEIGYGSLWKDVGLFFVKKSDVYFFISQLVPLFFFPKKYSVVVYDFAYRHLPAQTIKDRCDRVIIDLLTRISFRRSQKVIGISRATIEDAIALYGLSPQKGEVLYPGFFDVREVPVTPVERPEKYFLCIGTVKQRKNTLGVLQAYTVFHEKYPAYKLVIAGKYNAKANYVKSVFDFVDQHALKDSIVFFGHANDAQAADLYRNCFAVLFPSLLEGFGYPVLEAMSAGVPVITSNTSSTAEVAGGAALLVNPRNIDEISRAMISLVEHSDLRNQLIKKGSERIKYFSWMKTGETFISIIKRL